MEGAGGSVKGRTGAYAASVARAATKLAEHCCCVLAAAPNRRWGPPHLVAMVLSCCGKLGHKHAGVWGRGCTQWNSFV